MAASIHSWWSFSIFSHFGMFGPRKIWQPCHWTDRVTLRRRSGDGLLQRRGEQLATISEADGLVHLTWNPGLWSQFLPIFGEKNWRFYQKPMLRCKFCKKTSSSLSKETPIFSPNFSAIFLNHNIGTWFLNRFQNKIRTLLVLGHNKFCTCNNIELHSGFESRQGVRLFWGLSTLECCSLKLNLHCCCMWLSEINVKKIKLEPILWLLSSQLQRQRCLRLQSF
jgi:hypothetical protein